MFNSITLLLVLLFIGVVTSCNTFPPDDTPVWSKNNRFALEMENNCNLTTHSLGLSGCAFKGDVDPGAFIKLPSFWESRVDFISAKCGNKTYLLDKNRFLQLELPKIYQGTESCSFQINRTVKSIGGNHPDAQVIGRFFVKLLPNNRFYKAMKFELGENQFEGVGWYTGKPTIIPPPLMIYPQGEEGVILIKCGSETVMQEDFYDKPIMVDLPPDTSCDYEVSVINDDFPTIEFGTVVVEYSRYTVDIKKPKTYTKGKYLYFDFSDNVNADNKKVVVGAKINNFYCETYKCGARLGQTSYEVRAVTASLRYFYGVYYPETDTWEMK